MHIARGRVVLMLLINVKGHKTDVVVVVSAMHNMGMWPAGPHRKCAHNCFCYVEPHKYGYERKNSDTVSVKRHTSSP